jgi:hypothetical protein
VFFAFGLSLTGSQELIVVTPALLLVVILGNPKVGRDLFLFIAVLIGSAWLTGEFTPLIWFGYYTNRNIPFVIAFLPAAASAGITIIVTRRIASEWKPAARCLLCFSLGLAWSFYLPIASMTNPPMNWGYPRTVEGFFHVMGRGQYEGISPTHDLGRFIAQLWMMARDSGTGFGWVYFLFIPFPFCFLWHTNRTALNWILGLFTIFLCVGPLMIATLNPAPEYQSLKWTREYYAAMYAVLAVWTGLGLMAFANMVSKPPLRSQSPKHSI